MGWLLAALIGAAQAPRPALAVSDAACPVTTASLPFVPPAPYPVEPPGEAFWAGTPAFWTMVERPGQWTLGAGRLTRKVFWWRPGFDGREEAYPDVTVTLRRLATGETVVATRTATNAAHGTFGGWAMLTGITIPSAGCWEITGEHRGQAVSFVVRVTPE